MYRAYKISENDTMESLAAKFNTNINELVRLNQNFNFSNGEMIIVPSSSSLFDTYVVKKGDTIYNISSMYNVPYKDMLLLNGLDENDYIYPNQEILVPKDGVSFYITKTNDKVKDIVSKLGSNGYDVLSQNDNLLIVPDQIVVYKKGF